MLKNILLRSMKLLLMVCLSGCTTSISMKTSSPTASSLTYSPGITSTIEPTYSPTFTIIPTITPTSVPTLSPVQPGWIAVARCCNIDNGISSIDLISTDGKTRNQIALVGYFTHTITWSPDGQWIASFYSWRENDHIELIKVSSNGGELIPITWSQGDEFRPSWAPDNKYIAYTMDPITEPFQIYVLDLGLGESIKLTQNAFGSINPVYSPDEKYIVYQDFDGTLLEQYCSANLMIMKSDGSNNRKITNKLASCDRAAWSPDGSWITFSAYDPDKLCGQLYNVRPDGSDLTRLTDLPYCSNYPSWSPDGKQIAFIYLEENPREGVANPTRIYLMNADGSGLTGLEPPGSLSVSQWRLYDIAWAPVPRLAMEYSYRIAEPGNRLNLRTAPTVKGESVKILATGDTVFVLDGPVEADGYTWWKMRTMDGTEGWAVDQLGWYTWSN